MQLYLIVHLDHVGAVVSRKYSCTSLQVEEMYEKERLCFSILFFVPKTEEIFKGEKMS
jgi:hypothetical protein